MNIGLVLSGGMAKGAYQIGALKALENFLPVSEIKYISCASVGVLNGYAYATGSLERAEQMWKNICNNDARLVISQILRSSMLQQNINNIYDFRKKPASVFYSSLLDLSHRNIVYKNLSECDSISVPLYLKASVAMPVFNHSVTIDNISYYDGAMIDNIPVFPLMKHDPDYIICIYFDDICYKFENTYFDNKIIKISFRDKSILKQSVVFDENRILDMIKDGYDKTMYTLDAAFAKGYFDLEHIYRYIEHMNKNKGKYDLRVTGDMLVTNLNKLTQRLTKRKII